jgi:hypothetical protein
MQIHRLVHAPLDQDGIDNLMSLQQCVLERMSEDPYLDDVEHLGCSLQSPRESKGGKY